MEGIRRTLAGKEVVILVDAEYEDMEVWYPLLRLKEEGANVRVAGAKKGKTYLSKHGYPVNSDIAAGELSGKKVDGIIIPGGWAPDRLRQNNKVLKFVKEIFHSYKVIGAICHGASVLVSADVLKGKKVTCYKAIKDDVINAGADFLDKEVVRDGLLITSRTPSDLPAFCKEIILALAGKVREDINAIEALNLAIKAEEESCKFYSEAAKNVLDAEGRKMFQRLAGEEANHRSILEGEFERLKEKPDWQRYEDWREIL